MKNILVGIDFSEISVPLVDLAARLAEPFEATVRLVHVAPADPAIASSRSWPQEVRDELARELLEEHEDLETLAGSLQARQLDAKAIMQRGEVATRLLEVARKTDSDLIILGAERREGLSKLLPGSVVKDVLRRATCPVLVVPGQPIPME